MVVCCCCLLLFVVVFYLLQLCPILAYFFFIEALIELRKMLIRKKLFDVRFGNCSTPKVPRFCRFTKMQLTLLLDGRSVLDKFFFKMKFKECFISWCWSHTLLIIFLGFTAFKLQVQSKNKKIKFVPITIIMLPKINLEHLELLRPWGPQIQLHGGPRFVHETNFNTVLQ